LMHGANMKTVLPCLGVACSVHLEGDHLLHVASDNLEEEKCR
jgi:hypothetical protein